MADVVKLDPGYYADPDIGRPIANGYFYVGIKDLDPEIPANQKQVTVRQESGVEVQITQPVDLSSGGVPEYLGSPVTVLVDGVYSLKVFDSHDVQQYYVPESEESISGLIGYDHNSDGSHIVYNSIADLRASTLTPFDGQLIALTGYYSAGDGGGQKYGLQWDSTSTETDNGFSVFKVTAITTGRFKSVNTDIITLEQAGLLGDGVSDDSSLLQSFADNVAPGTKIISNGDKNYYIDSTVTFSTQVEFVGFGTFTTGTGVGNASTLVFSAEGSVIKDIEVVGDLRNSDGSAFTGTEDFSTNIKWTIEISGDNCVVENVKSSNSVRDIVFNGVTGGIARGNIITNGTVGAGSGLGTFGACITSSASAEVKILNNNLNGNIQGVLLRGTSSKCQVYSNTIQNTDDNAIYLSSGTETQVYSNTLYDFDATAIKMRGSYNKAFDNTIITLSAGSISGISVTGSGAVDSDGYNGYGNMVHNNSISGDIDIAIYIQDLDGNSHSEWHVTDNKGKLLGSTGTKTNYFIQLDGIGSEGCSISGNESKGHIYGIISQADTGKFFDRINIINNDFSKAITNGMRLNDFRYSDISHNNLSDSGAAGSDYAIKMVDSTYNTITHNNCGDFGSAVLTNAIVEEGATDFNEYKHNYTDGVLSTIYILLGESSTVLLDKINVETISGTKVLLIGEADKHWIDGGAGTRTVNPGGSVIWPLGHKLEIANTGSTNNLNFDTLGVNQAIAPGEVGVFVCYGFSAESLWTVVNVY
jgi:hypothetical protein